VTLLPGYSKNYNKALLLAGSLAILLPLPFHPRQDYGAYVAIWPEILLGNNPWIYSNGAITGNSYGPLFNSFAYLYGLNSHLPHTLFIIAWLGLSVFLLRQYGISAITLEKEKRLLFWFLILNPFFWIDIVSYGHFDSLLAICILFSILMREKRKYALSGALLAIGVLLKYIPIIILPFLVLEKRKIHVRLVFSFLSLFIFGMALGYILWGSSVFFPFTLSNLRDSTFLSIFRFLRSPYSPLPNLDGFSLWIMVGVWSPLILLHFWFDFEIFLITCVSLTSVLLFSKFGNPQYYTSLFFLVPYWWLNERKAKANPNKMILTAFLTPLVSLTSVNLIYAATQGFKNQWEWMDDTIGLPFFCLGMFCMVLMIREMLSFQGIYKKNPGDSLRN
jgi:hypothetical protein